MTDAERDKVLIEINERLKRLEDFFHIGPTNKHSARDVDRMADSIILECRGRKK
jgi:hypothetical protein